MRRIVGLVTTLMAVALPACRGRGAAEAEAGAASTAPASPVPQTAAGSPAGRGTDHLVPGTPAGGLHRWIADVRRGLPPLVRHAAGDQAAAQKSALELYLSRQEFIEMYWGASGKLTKGTELPAAVKEAETRFHAILEQLAPGKAADQSRLRAAILALDEQYGRVEVAASRAGVREDPHLRVGGVRARGTGGGD